MTPDDLQELHRPNDDATITKLIQLIVATGENIRRPTPQQVKSGIFNLFVTTGTITADGQGRLEQRGVQDFIRLISTRGDAETTF